ncbi:PrgH/EprH family type III secretion apparatus protein [Serratia marcescens]|uniref:PrgH/EprH family type III secretion apparatus protein n=1 Tax=Serratia marcescens TaxID=615 RepID=UPI00148CF536|nr:PrgH/EprH family type III secretion apparatus protein [Serratia marcescens]QJU42310.1 PrgH/EprH family type III secretion apparatus protein [Serratia marcescens]
MKKSKSPTLAEPIIIRFLNSGLKDCEFSLTHGVTHFFVSDLETISQQPLKKNSHQEAIFVPMSAGGADFDVIVMDGCSEIECSRVMLKEADKPAIDVFHSVSNQIIRVGELALAIRKQGETWHDDVVYYTESTDKGNFGPRGIIDSKSLKKAICVLLALSVLFFFIFFFFNNQKSKVYDVSSILGDKQSDYRFVRGSDSITYVLSLNNADQKWAEQAFVRTPPPSVVKVLDIVAEEERLSRWLTAYWPSVKLLRIKLAEPKNFLLTLSKERGELAPHQREALIVAIKKYLPYIEAVNFNILSDQLLESYAEQGLKKIAVPYNKVHHQESVTFLIQGSINDSQLERVKSFVQDFEARWGVRYVQFVIELKKDWLQGKSFKYGSEGYVKVSPSHWYFPKPLSLESNIND